MGQEHRELGGASIMIIRSYRTVSKYWIVLTVIQEDHMQIYFKYNIKMIKMDEQGPSYHLDVDAEAHDQAFL